MTSKRLGYALGLVAVVTFLYWFLWPEHLLELREAAKCERAGGRWIPGPGRWTLIVEGSCVPRAPESNLPGWG